MRRRFLLEAGVTAEEPDKPFSGRMMLRLPPELHRRAYVAAKKESKSPNQWTADKLRQAS